MNIVLFEDCDYQNLLPLVYFRPVWELRCGAWTVEERMQSCLAGNYFCLARDYLQRYYLPESQHLSRLPDDSPVLFINGRWLMNQEDADHLRELPVGEALVSEETLLAFRIAPSGLKGFLKEGLPDRDSILNELTQDQHPARIARYLWDLIEWNGELLIEDFRMWGKGGEIEGTVSPGVYLLNEENIYLAKSAQLKPGVVIDAHEGPVWIDEGVTVMPNAVLEGPIYIGKDSTVKIGAKLYGGTTIGPVCKVGGEVEGSIIQGFSNKQHDGFLGHSYLGAWINLGADTNNSDLKNNYGPIQVLLNGRLMDTGKQFLGLMMGDHSKTSINTMFNTGTIVGVNCNIFGAGMPPRFVPSFSWGGAEKLVAYRMDKIIEVAKLVMARRNVPFTPDDEQLFVEIKKLADRIEKVTSR